METNFFKLREKISNLCKILNFIAIILHCFKIYSEPTWIIIMVLSLFILLNSGWNLWRCPKENPEKKAYKIDIGCYAGILMVFGVEYLKNGLNFLVVSLGLFFCFISLIEEIKYIKMQIEKIKSA